MKRRSPMRDYQPKKNNPYKLPQNLYNEVKYLIKDYDRLCGEYEELTCLGEEERNWAKLCTVASKLAAVRTAVSALPPEFCDGILNNIANEHKPGGYFPPNADFRTYQSYKQKLIYLVAKNMNYV